MQALEPLRTNNIPEYACVKPYYGQSYAMEASRGSQAEMVISDFGLRS
jgi:hypothetical protein